MPKVKGKELCLTITQVLFRFCSFLEVWHEWAIAPSSLVIGGDQLGARRRPSV